MYRFPSLLLAATLLYGLCMAPAIATASSEEQELKELVDRSKTTLDNFMTDSNMEWLREHFHEASGVFIVPRMWKGGFILAGEGGRGILFSKDAKTGRWHGPAFYSIGTASGGLQAGLQVSEIVLLAMSQRGVDSLLSSTVKLGAGVSIAVGPVGVGVEGGTAVLSADLLTFVRAKGLFGGVSLDAAIIDTWDGANRTYYGKEVRPSDILMKHTVSNPQSAGLKEALARAAKGEAPSAEKSAPRSKP
ncbi:MAG: lipid-binding SYLF domain-containing protein [Nitrospira sp.]|nr:lipid-binding SYLF domain-containing protein [Nitrospira sp.]